MFVVMVAVCIGILSIALLFIAKKNFTNRKGSAGNDVNRDSIVPSTIKDLKAARGQISSGSYCEFSDILRKALKGYIQRAYKIPAFTITTEELVNHMLSNAENDLNLIGAVSDILRVVDSVKYSNRKLSVAQQRGIYKKACRFVLSSERFFRQKSRR